MAAVATTSLKAARAPTSCAVAPASTSPTTRPLRAAVRIDLATGQGFGGDAEGDRLSGIENVEGSARGDHLTGNAAGNRLLGGDGDDVIFGGGGNDVIVGGPGADKLDGGAGIDTVDYSRVASGLTIDLVAGQDADGYPYGTISGFERVIGTAFNDRLRADGGANGLIGGAGDDFLLGGLGRDELTGGTGADRFRFSFTTESGVTAATRDVVHDFRHAEGDHLDFSQMDASTSRAGDQDPTFIGQKAFTAEGQVRYFFEGDHTVVEVNTTGNSGADMQIQLDRQVQPRRHRLLLHRLSSRAVGRTDNGSKPSCSARWSRRRPPTSFCSDSPIEPKANGCRSSEGARGPPAAERQPTMRPMPGAHRSPELPRLSLGLLGGLAGTRVRLQPRRDPRSDTLP